MSQNKQQHGKRGQSINIEISEGWHYGGADYFFPLFMALKRWDICYFNHLSVKLGCINYIYSVVLLAQLLSNVFHHLQEKSCNY
jgi:N-acetyl-beta-hexosaminidase